MIVKKRGIPRKLLGLTALNNRLYEDHELKERVKEELGKVKAGYGGEQNFDKHLLEFLPEYPHAILHDICLRQDGIFFQMDSLLITPASILIFEVKNIAGKLLFMENPDRFVRQLSTGETQPMQSPIAQLERKKHFLRKWLINHGVHVPVKVVVVLAYSNEIHPIEKPNNPITFAYQVPNFLHSLSLEMGPLNGEVIKKLSYKMSAQHEEYNPFPMKETWNLPDTAIQRGVQCVSCGYFGMNWRNRKWACPKCSETGADNHIATINDWFYLMDERITNRQFRKFTFIEDPDIAKRLLKKAGLNLKGKRKSSYYTMKE